MQIDYKGDPVSGKDKKEIERMISYEVAFYSQFGLSDTLVIQLHVFDDKRDGFAYLEGMKIFPHRHTGGLYFPDKNEVFILGREKGHAEGLRIIYHELSHHFTKMLLDYPPIWLNEGLAEYFEYCEINKKGIATHILSDYERGRLRTIYMLDEVNLSDLVNINQKHFMEQQHTDEGYSYILSHALVTFWIEKQPDIFKKLVSSLQKKEDVCSVFERIDRIYPGGFSKLEEDFAAFCR